MLNPLIDIGDAHMAEKVGAGLWLLLVKDPLDGLLRHAHSVVRDGNLQILSFLCLIQMRFYDDFPHGTFGLDAVKKGVFHDGLKGKTVNHARIQVLGLDPVIDGDAAPIAVLLDQKIVFYQIKLLL